MTGTSPAIESSAVARQPDADREMEGQSMSAGSFAAFPGAPHVGVLFVEAFGRLTRDTGRAGLASDEEDLYSIF
ncbi:MAG TPA: hypothetical protein VKZ96_00785, partial [Thermomicrobiales bacterium]|nr:hypothetical protein [Thermomicrobiales bacterium]